MNALDLLKTQMELECKGLNELGDMIPIPCANPDEIPRVYAARHKDGYTVFFRYDLAPHLRNSLAALPPRFLFTDHQQIKSILSQAAPCKELWVGKSYIFPEILRPTLYPDVLYLPDQCKWVIVTNEQIVSSCASARENNSAGEAWTFTEPGYRKRGYGRQVTAAWAQALREKGKIPFYSHLNNNPASEGIARSLGLIQFIEVVAYS